MKRQRLLIILILAHGLGGLAGYLALNYIASQARPLVAAEPQRGRIVVAARELPIGSIVRQEDVKVIEWPADAMPAGYSSSPAQVVGRGVITALVINEPLLDSNLADKEAGGGLPIVVPEGMRAMSMRVNDVSAVAGFVIPGTRVDVLLTKTPEDSEEQMTRIIMQNVQALTAGQVIQQDEEGKPISVGVVTVLVTPEQAEKLALATSEGEIRLALRNTLDIGEVETPGFVAGDLLDGGAPRRSATRAVRPRPTQRPSTPEGVVVEMFRGGDRTLKTFRN